jgi:hypothetical protein
VECLRLEVICRRSEGRPEEVLRCHLVVSLRRSAGDLVVVCR